MTTASASHKGLSKAAGVAHCTRCRRRRIYRWCGERLNTASTWWKHDMNARSGLTDRTKMPRRRRVLQPGLRIRPFVLQSDSAVEVVANLRWQVVEHSIRGLDTQYS